ncbi:FG-GAP repeat domain-containing protein [Streptomyces sp. NBC_01358]|uniref:FG-GAP repeat domain-containing protein n=1 Tax=Streptomyces sp. NBC_01358 TaxID=2903837 RepID=UPI002E351FBB|nr:VCBS repeat-containing protein [Streptomyces sp. NBC_01358]
MSICAAAITLTGGLVAVAPHAAAAGPHYFDGDAVIPPGSTWYANASNEGDDADGDLIYAFSTKPLTSPGGDGAGLPEGVTRITGDELDLRNKCVELDGFTAVYRCPVVPSHSPIGINFRIAPDAPDSTTYFGYAFVPSGEDLAEGIKTAQTAGELTSITSGMGSLTVKTPAHAAINKVEFETPDLNSGSSVHHRLRLQIADEGQLRVGIQSAAGQPTRAIDSRIKLSDIATSAGVDCAGTSLVCHVSPGEQTIDYTVTAASGLNAWRFETSTRYNIYSEEWPSLWDEFSAQSGFAMSGEPLRLNHRLLTHESTGKLQDYQGTGKAAAPFYHPRSGGSGWSTYNAVTKLSPVTEDLDYYGGAAAPAADLRGRGDAVGRDSTGHLWYYHRKFGGWPFSQRTPVGAGWQVYNVLTGGGDVNGDQYTDLLARDAAGVLWLYKGTGSASAPFTARTRIGGGWNTYNRLAGSADLTNDGKPDLLARDAAGVLWLYKGTGNASAPFTARTRIGGGWNTYNALSVVGDLTQDLKPDLVARDSAGVLWLYKGTGNASAPFTARTQVGGGWNAYNTIL